MSAVLLPVAIALLAAAAPVSGTSECPSPTSVGALLPPLSSAVQVDVAAVEGGALVRLLDRQGQVLDQQTLRGADCPELARAAADLVRRWAGARGALRPEGALPPPPLVELPEGEAPSARPAAPAAAPWPFIRLPEPPVALGLGGGAGGMADAPGGAPVLFIWGAAGPKGSPLWGELGILASTPRSLRVGSLFFGWSRTTVTLGAGYRPPLPWTLDLMAGLLGSQLQASTYTATQVLGFSSFDLGLYGGVRARLPAGPLNLWAAGTLNAWLVDHQLRVASPEGEERGSIPVLAACGLVGVAFGGGP